MANVGYIRVSTVDQNTARQLDGLELDKVFTEHKSGKDKDREQLKAMLDYVRELMLERQREGIAKAKEDGKYKGRTKSIDDNAIRLAMSKENASFRKVAKELGVSLSTVQRAMKND